MLLSTTSFLFYGKTLGSKSYITEVLQIQSRKHSTLDRWASQTQMTLTNYKGRGWVPVYMITTFHVRLHKCQKHPQLFREIPGGISKRTQNKEERESGKTKVL